MLMEVITSIKREKSMVGPQKSKIKKKTNSNLIITTLDIELKKTRLLKQRFPYCSTIHNSQDMQST